MNDDSKQKRPYHNTRDAISAPVMTTRVNMNDLLSQRQLDILVENGLPQNHGKNSAPVAHLTVDKIGYSFLLTEAVPGKPLCFYGIADYDTRLDLGFIDFAPLVDHLNKHPMDGSIDADDTFSPKFNLAVYALVANNARTILVDDSAAGYADIFARYVNDETCDGQASLQQFAPGLQNFHRFNL